MIAICGLPRREWERMTLRELVIYYGARQIDRWWPYAQLSSQIYNLTTVVVNALSKKGKSIRPKSPSDFHPFVKPIDRRFKITAKNIGVLKTIGNALCQKR